MTQKGSEMLEMLAVGLETASPWRFEDLVIGERPPSILDRAQGTARSQGRKGCLLQQQIC